MKVTKTNSLTNSQIIEKLSENYFETTEKSTLWGQIITAKVGKLSFMIKNKKNFYTLELVIPNGVMILSFVIGLVLASILTTVIYGQVVIIKGGFIVVLISILIGSSIYKSQNSKSVKFYYEKIKKILES